jgi:hypothetical protein
MFDSAESENERAKRRFAAEKGGEEMQFSETTEDSRRQPNASFVGSHPAMLCVFAHISRRASDESYFQNP